jgi:hypothetical protein
MPTPINPNTLPVSTYQEYTAPLPQGPAPQSSSLDAPAGLPSRRTSPNGPVSPRTSSLAALQSPSPELEIVIDPTTVARALHSRAEARSAIGPASSFEGEVSVKDGRLHSPQPQINALLRYARLDPAQVMLGGPVPLTLTLDPGIARLHDDLQETLAVKALAVRPRENTPLIGGATYDVKVELLALHMHEMLQEGGARSNVAVHLPDGRGVSVHDALASMRPSIASPHAALADAIQQKVDADPDLRAKLAAASMLQIATRKETDMVGLAGSLTVSAGIGTAWETLASPAVALAMEAALASTGMSAPTRAILSTLGKLALDSAPPLVIETLDNLFVLAIIEKMKGNAEHRMLDKLPEALTAGAISMFLSVPNNVADTFKTSVKWLDSLLTLATNQVAVAGASSGVPPAVKRDMEHMHAAAVAHLASGKLVLPEGKDLVAHGQELARRAVAMDPGTSIATQSVAVAAIAGTIPPLLGKDFANLLDDATLRIVRDVLFQPIEAISMNLLVPLARMGVPGVVKSDQSKHTGLVQLVLDKAGTGPGGRAAPIRAQDLDALFGPQILDRMGQGVADGINGTLAGARAVAAKVGLMQPSQGRLVDQLDIEAIRREQTSPV